MCVAILAGDGTAYCDCTTLSNLSNRIAVLDEQHDPPRLTCVIMYKRRMPVQELVPEATEDELNCLQPAGDHLVEKYEVSCCACVCLVEVKALHVELLHISKSRKSNDVCSSRCWRTRGCAKID